MRLLLDREAEVESKSKVRTHMCVSMCSDSCGFGVGWGGCRVEGLHLVMPLSMAISKL